MHNITKYLKKNSFSTALKLSIICFVVVGFTYGCGKNNKPLNGNNTNANQVMSQNNQTGNKMSNNQMNNNQANQSSSNGKKEKIRTNWTAFFSSNTQNQKRMQLLQNGRQFKKTFQHFSNSQMGKDASVKVNSVTLNGSGSATVNYTIELRNKPVLKNQKGKALLVNNTWKVSDAAFCGLLAMSGNVPKACPQASNQSNS